MRREIPSDTHVTLLCLVTPSLLFYQHFISSYLVCMFSRQIHIEGYMCRYSSLQKRLCINNTHSGDGLGRELLRCVLCTKHTRAHTRALRLCFFLASGKKEARVKVFMWHLVWLILYLFYTQNSQSVDKHAHGEGECFLYWTVRCAFSGEATNKIVMERERSNLF